jgi:FK506-binding nuclear protein
MAAIDPTEEAELDDSKPNQVPRSTLRLVKRAFPGLDADDDENDLSDSYIQALLGNSDDEDDEANGGPSDPAKAKKQKQAAALKQLLEATNGEGSEDEDMEDAETNGVKSKKGKKESAKGKGKGKAVEQEVDEDEDDEDDEDDYDDEEEGDLENFVLCTLDTERVSNLSSQTKTHLINVFTDTHSRTTSSLSTSPSTRARRSSLLSQEHTLFT